MTLKAALALSGFMFLELTSASFSGNLNYDSPSKRHDHLGIDIDVVSRRTLKRGSVPFLPSQLNFTHGVASGDPYPDSVILWTRIAPSDASDKSNTTVEGTVPLYSHETEKYIKADANPICAEWKVWEPRDKGTMVAEGTAYTTSDIDFTLKVEAKSLKPFTLYNYQFTVCGSGKSSPVGKTKTSPSVDDDTVKEIKMAVFSCSNYPGGHFNAMGNAARKDEHDFVIHLGDYIYEGGRQGKRPHNPPRTALTLWDYRTRHGQYRTDPDLLLLAQNSAWITTWDDHEVSDNGWRDGSSSMNNTEQSFRNYGFGVSVDQRKMNAVRAYFEWMPIRQVELDDNLRIWRSFKMGKLLDLVMLDTRNYDRSITGVGWNDAYIKEIHNDASRSLMGSRQENWFYRTLSESAKRGATWRIVGNQVLFSQFVDDGGGDSWGAYAANRNRTFQHLYDNKINNNVFLTGDTHRNWVSDLAWQGAKKYDPATGQGAVGVELAGTAISSSSPRRSLESSFIRGKHLIQANAQLQWQESYYRGYFLLSARKDKLDAKFYGTPSIATRNSWDLPLANFTVIAGENHLARPVAGGKVETGYLRSGKTVSTNVTLDTSAKTWKVVGIENMYFS
ncbi:PhoD-like phosphatase-domain-containing protein [Podospora didyma]|uniref:PhoD-like phosphatase-domain-containing protein n=1 Tax=Podospora didyma TaxID=330526 RepID=A0AAE0NUG7_9PEZI|nr:PhoD-like phosphatase-domain-containing protein [Podospora didyma]